MRGGALGVGAETHAEGDALGGALVAEQPSTKKPTPSAGVTKSLESRMQEQKTDRRRPPMEPVPAADPAAG